MRLGTSPRAEVISLVRTAFSDPDPWHQIAYASALDARRGIAALLARPLGRLGADDLQFVDELLARTLDKAEIASAVRTRFNKKT